MQRDFLTITDRPRVRIALGATAMVVVAGALLPVGDDNALAWLVDLCLPDGAAMPDMKPIAMQHSNHFAAKAAVGLGVVSAGLLYAGTRSTPADPDRVLAAMAFMANATPGYSPARLSDAVARQTGFELSAQDAAEALRCYTGLPCADDLNWIAKGATPTSARTILTAALSVGWDSDGFSPAGLKTLGALARAFGMTGDELAALLPQPIKVETEVPDYDLFPAVDSVSHWIGRVLGASKPQITSHRHGEYA